jgi:hypothetical protein
MFKILFNKEPFVVCEKSEFYIRTYFEKVKKIQFEENLICYDPNIWAIVKECLLIDY